MCSCYLSKRSDEILLYVDLVYEKLLVFHMRPEPLSTPPDASQKNQGGTQHLSNHRLILSERTIGPGYPLCES